MIVEEREYTVRYGGLDEFVELYRSVVLPVQLRHLKSPLGFFTTDVGELSLFVHMWRFSDYTHRDAERAALKADPQWSSCKMLVLEQVVGMRNRILKTSTLAKSKSAVWTATWQLGE
jgi:hypothetical protein